MDNLKAHNNTKETKSALHMLNSAITNLSRMKADYCRTYELMRDIDRVISQINITKEIIAYKNRLPWYEIEQEVIALYKRDRSVHGVTLSLIFKPRNEADLNRLSILPIYTKDYGKAV